MIHAPSALIHAEINPRRLARRQSACSARRRNGAVAMEFALACPLLILLSLACADFGRIFYFYETVSNSARSGAEAGATQQFTDFTRADWEAAVRDAVVAELANLPNFDESQLTYNLSTTTDSGNAVRIAVSVSYPFRMTISWPGLPSVTQLHNRVEFRQFR